MGVSVTDDLTKELQRVFRAITEESSDNQNGFTENVDRAIQTLLTLRDLKKQQSIEHDRPLSRNIVSTGTKRLGEGPPSLLLSYLKGLSSSNLSQQKEAARSLRWSTKLLPPFRAYFSKSKEFLSGLLDPLTRSEINPYVRRDLIMVLRNLSIDNETNKKMVAQSLMMVVPILLDALRSGTVDTRINAADTLFALSALDANTKSLIGKAGALEPLIDLLEEGHSFVMKEVASAIRTLCIDDENKGRAVEIGAVRVVLKKIEERVVFVDELLGILVVLSDHPQAVAEMADLGAVSCLFSVIKETDWEQDMENCIVVIHRICFKDESKWKEMRDEEGTISKIAETGGSSIAKRNAYQILHRIGIRA